MDLTRGPLSRNIILYAVPIIVTSLLQLLFNAADLIVVGRFCGSVSVAAVGAVTSLCNIFVSFVIGLSVGVGVTAARSIGAGDDRRTALTIHTAIPLGLIFAVILTVIVELFAPAFLTMMYTPEDVFGLSLVYMRIYFYGIVSSILYNFGAAVLRADGDTRRPLIFLSLAGVVNIVLNVFFVVAFRLNVAGVALATTISQTMAAAMVLVSLARRSDACRLCLRRLTLDLRLLLEILRIGIPAAIQSSLFSLSNVFIQSSINGFGSAVMAGHAASNSLGGGVYVTSNAFSQTCMNFVGQNYGAGRHDRIYRTIRLCLVYGSLFVTALTAVIWLFMDPLLGLYITDSPAAVSVGRMKYLYTYIPYFLYCLQDVLSGAMRGLGISFVPMLISVFCICVFRVAWLYAVFSIPRFHDLATIFLSYPISWILSLVMHLAAFRYYRKRLLRPPGTDTPT